jgi:hypothetical protein
LRRPPYHRGSPDRIAHREVSRRRDRQVQSQIGCRPPGASQPENPLRTGAAVTLRGSESASLRKTYTVTLPGKRPPAGNNFELGGYSFPVSKLHLGVPSSAGLDVNRSAGGAEAIAMPAKRVPLGPTVRALRPAESLLLVAARKCRPLSPSTVAYSVAPASRVLSVASTRRALAQR